MPAGLLQVLDLHNQYYRITDQDADQRQHAEDRNGSEWRPARQHSRDDADQCKRSDRKHQEQAVKALQLDHQDRGHDKEHQRNDGRYLSLALGGR